MTPCACIDGFREIAPGFYEVCRECNARNPVRRPEEPAPPRRPNDWNERAADKRRAWAKARGL